MTEKDKLAEAARSLGFAEVTEVPLVGGLPEGHTCQIWAKEQIGGGSKLYMQKPSKIQCAAMRAVLYMWKALRLVEASITEDASLDSYAVLRFYKASVQVKLPDEMSGGVVTPVRVACNLIVGEILEQAIKTRGHMEDPEEKTEKTEAPRPPGDAKPPGDREEEITQVKKVILPDDAF